jgi:hypothetical protein
MRKHLFRRAWLGLAIPLLFLAPLRGAAALAGTSPTLEPGIRAQLMAVEFSSDHRRLGPSASLSDWSDGTGTFPKPEWRGGQGSAYPISQTLGTPLAVTATLVVTPPGARFDLVGEGFQPWSRFQARGLVATGQPQQVPLVAGAALPASVGILTETIRWQLVGDGASGALGTMGPFRIYTTYGTPQGSPVTECRMNWCCTTAAGQASLSGMADAIWTAVTFTHGGPPRFALDPAKANVPNPLWLLMSSTAYNGQCIHLATLMQMMVQMLGGTGNIGYIYGSSDADCFSPSPMAPEQRDCPAHGRESIAVHSAPNYFCVLDGSGWNHWEAVCQVAGTCYAVQVGRGAPLQVLRQWLGPNQPCQGADNWQFWMYWGAGLDDPDDPAVLGQMGICRMPGPFPVPLP